MSSFTTVYCSTPESPSIIVGIIIDLVGCGVIILLLTRTPRRPTVLNFCSHSTHAASPINACPAALSTIKCSGGISIQRVHDLGTQFLNRVIRERERPSGPALATNPTIISHRPTSCPLQELESVSDRATIRLAKISSAESTSQLVFRAQKSVIV